jgi:hypothetical protein
VDRAAYPLLHHGDVMPGAVVDDDRTDCQLKVSLQPRPSGSNMTAIDEDVAAPVVDSVGAEGKP